METSKFVYVTHINTTPERLWSALTRPEFTQQYWAGRRIQSDWTTGASVKLLKADGGIDLNGEVLKAEPPHVLSYTFQHGTKEGEAPNPITHVTFQISVSYGVTKLTVVHDGFDPGSEIFQQLGSGWQAILSSLKTLLETGVPLPFTYPR